MTVIQKKICLLGDIAVGKTSLIRRFVEGRFDDKYLSTVGVKVSRKPVPRPYGTLNLLIWELSATVTMDFNVQASYMRGAAGAMVVCDLTRPETLGGLERFTRRMLALNPQASFFYAANKADLADERAITDADLQAACAALSEEYIITSAKTGEQVEAAFLRLAELIEMQK